MYLSFLVQSAFCTVKPLTVTGAKSISSSHVNTSNGIKHACAVRNSKAPWAEAVSLIWRTGLVFIPVEYNTDLTKRCTTEPPPGQTCTYKTYIKTADSLKLPQFK